jgi:hypothetical protein
VPLKIVPPRHVRTSHLYIRGAYLGVRVDKSSGTDRRSVAQTILKRIEREIERGEYQKAKVASKSPTFLSAAIAYVEAGRRKRYVARLIKPHLCDMDAPLRRPRHQGAGRYPQLARRAQRVTVCAVTSEEWDRVELLPAVGTLRGPVS